MTLLKHNGLKSCFVALDLNVPAPKGIEIAPLITQTIPDVPVIALSGYADLAERPAPAALPKS